MRRIRSRCWARTTSGNAAAVLPNKAMNSRRLMRSSQRGALVAYHNTAESAAVCVTANSGDQCLRWPEADLKRLPCTSAKGRKRTLWHALDARPCANGQPTDLPHKEYQGQPQQLLKKSLTPSPF